MTALSQQTRFLGDCVDQLYDIRALLECQFDSLLGLQSMHSDQSHHMSLNQTIRDKVVDVSNQVETIHKKLREKEIVKCMI